MRLRRIETAFIEQLCVANQPERARVVLPRDAIQRLVKNITIGFEWKYDICAPRYTSSGPS